jgi:hypothetical protein
MIEQEGSSPEEFQTKQESNTFKPGDKVSIRHRSTGEIEDGYTIIAIVDGVATAVKDRGNQILSRRNIKVDELAELQKLIAEGKG